MEIKIIIRDEKTKKEEIIKSYEIKSPEDIGDIGLKLGEIQEINQKINEKVVKSQMELYTDKHSKCSRCGEKYKRNGIEEFFFNDERS